MPLKIQLKPKERIIINGAVIEGQEDTRTEIVVLNKARILRKKHIMQQEEADTPVKRLYFSLQMLYIDPDNKDEYLENFEQFLKDLEETLTLDTLTQSLENIKNFVSEARYYDAMKVCRELRKVEEELLKIDPSK